MALLKFLKYNDFHVIQTGALHKQDFYFKRNQKTPPK